MRLESGARQGPPPSGAIWIGKDLASRLALKVGSQVKFGEKAFLIDGIIAEEPDRLGEGFTLGPVAIIGLSDLPATRLIQPGSLYESKYHLRLPGSANPEAVGKALTAEFPDAGWDITDRSEEHTSELQSLMRISYAVLCLKKKNTSKNKQTKNT